MPPQSIYTRGEYQSPQLLLSPTRGGQIQLGKILVLYDSGYGATAEAAETIAATLTGRGLNVDLRTPEMFKPVWYDAAIIGSPIRFGQYSPKIKQFIRGNFPALLCIPVGFFFSCMSVTDDVGRHKLPLYIDPSLGDSSRLSARIKFMENYHTTSHYLRTLLEFTYGICPMGISFFNGRLDMSNLSMFHRMAMSFAMIALPGMRYGNYLNQAAIQHWAELIYRELKAGQFHRQAISNRLKSKSIECF